MSIIITLFAEIILALTIILNHIRSTMRLPGEEEARQVGSVPQG